MNLRLVLVMLLAFAACSDQPKHPEEPSTRWRKIAPYTEVLDDLDAGVRCYSLYGVGVSCVLVAK